MLQIQDHVQLGCAMGATKGEKLKTLGHDLLVPATPQHKDKQSGMPEMIEAIRVALRSMGDGEISISAYDTAWVALVRSLNNNGDDGPEFPSCIDWIAQNQLPDGSWGHDIFFLAQDRIINTLACVIALKSWKIHDDACTKGLSFITENMWRLTRDDENWALSGFEIIFPMLLEKAKHLGIDIPLDDPMLEAIRAKRELKLNKIPREALHAEPTTFLLSIEGMPGLDWKRLRKLQCPDGSYMSSPAPTAYALMQTGDAKCFEFLDKLIDKFNGGVPFVYPMEMFGRLWAVDRLERLGISGYFKSEIEDYLDYVYRHWSEEGLAYTKGCLVKDIDDTAMGFRLLRLHGYDHVSPCVFKRFENGDGQFVCYARQSSQSVSAMYNLYRAADQASFPGDDDDHVLRRARSYSRAFLRQRRASGQLNDKWIISEGLPDEVGYGLDFPWGASLPRIETRMYLEQYGGSRDVWIGKVLYRMNMVSNDMYLEVAKVDFSNFQRLCRLEWHDLKRWCDKSDLETYGVAPGGALRAYFLAAACIFEPGQAAERLAWARAAVLAKAISCCLLSNNDTCACNKTTAEWLVREFTNGDNVAGYYYDYNPARRDDDEPNSPAWGASSLAGVLRELVHLQASGNAAVAECLRGAWMEWLMAWTEKETEEASHAGDTALLLARTVEICSGRLRGTEQDLELRLPDYSKLQQLTRCICSRLATEAPALIESNVLKQNGETMDKVDALDRMVGLEMRELAQCVFRSGGSSVDRETRQTFLHVTKSYYYVALCSPETLEHHISKVLFEDVV
ncbi:ent-copalyl diphosphate synthase 2 isoform X3 [Zea mays]|uniref:ent-copalyl diphosphate synthase n=1 Tax=Zea mays TaxID=4577 RepID=A0A804NKD2_MAIZE|nr:ent-copalyl diphosphate synthase 2 isoform X3 [Zea mays]|eukprot:XP_020408033.1 ent-copalyl diphosphate synthase 2 isoform X3 [Zea mays]